MGVEGVSKDVKWRQRAEAVRAFYAESMKTGAKLRLEGPVRAYAERFHTIILSGVLVGGPGDDYLDGGDGNEHQDVPQTAGSRCKSVHDVVLE